jgi:spore maturation protein CgeB
MIDVDKRFQRLLIIGNPGKEHVGAHFLGGAQHLGMEAVILDTNEAWVGPKWFRRFYWHLARKRPTSLMSFSRKVVTACRQFQPDALLCTGVSPVAAQCLREIGRLGIPRVNFLTDDPWNAKNGAGFFWNALLEYDVVFTPRKSNINDLMEHGCSQVAYLPFAYNPALHFYEPSATAQETQHFSCDAATIGGADADRIPLAMALAAAGFTINLYGGYWDRTPALRPFWKGFVYDRQLRLAARCATVNLCMGRKANRDGHAMRSFELPAMGACMVVEDTGEHRDIFGKEGDAVAYYASTNEMLSKVAHIKNHPQEARRLATKARELITGGRNTYKDRLVAILDHLRDSS